MFYNIRRIFEIFSIIFVLFPAAHGIQALEYAPDAATTDTAARGRNLLLKLEDKYRDTMFFYGEFRQKKTSRLFLEEISSNGKFWYQKPGAFRCEYLPPYQQVNLILDDAAYVYIPEIKQVEVYRFKAQDSPVRKLNQMLLGFGVSVRDVLDVYDVHLLQEKEKSNAFILQFLLKKKEEGLNFDEIRIWLDKDKLQPLRLLFIELEPSRDETQIDIKNLEFNKKIKPQVFKPEFPRDAEVIEQN